MNWTLVKAGAVAAWTALSGAMGQAPKPSPAPKPKAKPPVERRAEAVGIVRPVQLPAAAHVQVWRCEATGQTVVIVRASELRIRT